MKDKGAPVLLYIAVFSGIVSFMSALAAIWVDNISEELFNQTWLFGTVAWVGLMFWALSKDGQT